MREKQIIAKINLVNDSTGEVTSKISVPQAEKAQVRLIPCIILTGFFGTSDIRQYPGLWASRENVQAFATREKIAG